MLRGRREIRSQITFYVYTGNFGDNDNKSILCVAEKEERRIARRFCKPFPWHSQPYILPKLIESPSFHFPSVVAAAVG